MPKKKKEFKIDLNEIEKTFRENEPLYKNLEIEAVHTLKHEIEKTSIKIHSIPSKIKEKDSFLNKIQLYQIESPFESIQDIVGLRVICLFLTDIEKIGNIIRDTFEVVKEDNKIDNSKFTSFGYMSVHFICRLGKDFKGTRYNNICDFVFEIQVRTIAMDAWANISHYLDYKTDKDIPDELKRDFYALSGMFYVADKHFQMFFEQREENTEAIAEVFEKGKEEDINSQPINLDTLKAFLREKLPEYLQANDLSDYVEDIRSAGFKTIGEISNLFDLEIESIKAEADRQLKNDEKYSAIILSSLLKRNNYIYYKKYMERYTGKRFAISEEEWNKFYRRGSVF